MRKTHAIGITLALAMGWGMPASADSLRDALAAAYSSNPTLAAARAQLRATDEGLARANSNFLPQLSAGGSFNRQKRDSNPTTTNKFYQARVDQNLFNGFQDFNNRRLQNSLIESGRASLTLTEQQVLLDGVTVYSDLLRDEAVVELNRNNVQVLGRQLQASQDRFRVGEITRTDVAQSQARLAGARSQLISSSAELAASRSRYERIIGHAPGTLDPQPDLPGLPETLDVAWSMAAEDNPFVQAAHYNEEAARHDVNRLKGTMLPRADAFLSISRSEGESFFAGQSVDIITTSKIIGVQVNIPLYQGGGEYSDIRRAKQTRSQRLLQIREAERLTRENVRTTWERYFAAIAGIESNQAQVDANEIALEGVRQEAAVGSRTTLDVLDAEQELLDSRVNLARAERDEYVAGFSLISSLGQLTASALDLPVELYDPEDNTGKVKWKFVGWGTNN